MKSSGIKNSPTWNTKWLFPFTVVAFIVECSILAVTSRFPMAFDETYHLSLIQFFSYHLNPIITSQGSSTYKMGAIIQNPSFLYHYLMGFPYRVIELFTHNAETQVISLRLINVALAVGALFMIRRLLLELNLKRSLTDIIILLYAFTPIVAVLSSQINYDNLFVPMFTLCAYLTLKFVKVLDKGSLDIKLLLLLVSLCMLTSLVKFAFLPGLVTIFGLVGFRLYRRFNRGESRLTDEIKISWLKLGFYSRVFLLSLTLIAGFLFIRFYGVNLVKYKNPEPQCNQVLNVADCKQYYSWDNNYLYHQARLRHPTRLLNFPAYSILWLAANYVYVFGEVIPKVGIPHINTFFLASVDLIVVVGVACLLRNLKSIIRHDHRLLLISWVPFVYFLFLWGRLYYDYLYLGHAVAFNGRYLIPLIPYVYAWLALGISYALRSQKLILHKRALAAIAVLVFVFFGGGVQYITYVDPYYGRLSPLNSYTLQSTK
ncbi:MAG TPA: hypothetical protein VH234_01190 [Candidatus Saccharimonadales bacterium]|nr:hypothetical protein [Candidatus Saccharimonadales bacterium]